MPWSRRIGSPRMDHPTTLLAFGSGTRYPRNDGSLGRPRDVSSFLLTPRLKKEDPVSFPPSVLTLPSKSPFWPRMNTNRIPMNKERSNYIIQVGSSAFYGYFLSSIMKWIVRSVIYSIIRKLHQRSGDFDSATTGYCKSRTAFRVPKTKKGDEGKHSSPCLTLGKSFIEQPIFLSFSFYIRSPKTLFSNHALPPCLIGGLSTVRSRVSIKAISSYW